MKRKYIIIIFIGILMLGIGAGAYLIFRPGPPDILDLTKQQVGFTLFAPDRASKTWKLDKNTIDYNKNTSVLVFTLNNAGNTNKIVMSQQATPDPFTDIPNYPTLFFSKLNQYQELHVSLGTIALTHPTELKGGQSAVGNIRGTLMFLHPSTDLTDDEWKDVLNELRAL